MSRTHADLVRSRPADKLLQSWVEMPDPAAHCVYDRLYFGRGPSEVMKRLRALRRESGCV